jgi:RNA polymerase sigma-70 factor (ECF subfamily)
VCIDRFRVESRAANAVAAIRLTIERSPEGPSMEHAWTAWEVRRAVEGLPRGLREVVRLVYLKSRPHHEIAERLGIPLGTVRSRLFRARQLLADALAHLDVCDDEARAA